MRGKLVAVLLVTALCLGWVLWGLDLSVAVGSLGEVRWGWMLGVFALYAASHSLRALRWRVILGRPIGFVRVLSILSIGYLAIHVVPLRMGEFVRPTLLAEKEEVPFGAGLAAIFLERLVDMLMLLGMMFLVGFAVELPEGRVRIEGIDVLEAGQRAIGLLVGVGALGLAALLAVGEPLLRLADRLPGGAFVRRFREGLLALAARPAAALGVLVSSVVIWGMTVAAVQLSLLAFPGLPATAGVALTTWTVTLTGMTIAPTPGFFGAFEAFCSGALVLLGADGDRARTFALLLHLGQFGFTVATGVAFLAWEGSSLRDVVGRSRAAPRIG